MLNEKTKFSICPCQQGTAINFETRDDSLHYVDILGCHSPGAWATKIFTAVIIR